VAEQPPTCFSFVFTPKHGSRLNLVEGALSKMTRSVLRHIRIGSKAELKHRILAHFDLLNQDPTART
jgi:transposase